MCTHVRVVIALSLFKLCKCSLLFCATAANFTSRSDRHLSALGCCRNTENCQNVVSLCLVIDSVHEELYLLSALNFPRIPTSYFLICLKQLLVDFRDVTLDPVSPI